MPFLSNRLTVRFPAERTLDFTCCDVEPAVLGKPFVPPQRSFQLTAPPPIPNSPKRSPLDDDHGQRSVRRSAFTNLELILPFLSRRKVALVPDCAMPNPRRGLRIHCGVEQLKVLQVPSHVQREHPSRAPSSLGALSRGGPIFVRQEGAIERYGIF